VADQRHRFSSSGQRMRGGNGISLSVKRRVPGMFFVIYRFHHVTVNTGLHKLISPNLK
jgi:hypothetical protein